MKSIHGFTLVEVAIVMVIIGLVLAASIAPLSSQIQRSKAAETDVILNDVMEALYGFAAVNGRLPCPTDANRAPPIPPGTEAPIGGGACNPGGVASVSGFVPGVTLGLSGKYNDDGLLLDAWGNPIRYSVIQLDTFDVAGVADLNTPDFTTPTDMRIVTINQLNTAANLVPNQYLKVCTTSTAAIPPNTCAAGTALTTNAVAIVISLGQDGARASVQGGGISPAEVDQFQNSGERTLPPATVSGISYQVGGATDLLFIDRGYQQTTTGNGIFDDRVKWMSPNTLYAKMIAAGQLP